MELSAKEYRMPNAVKSFRQWLLCESAMLVRLDFGGNFDAIFKSLISTNWFGLVIFIAICEAFLSSETSAASSPRPALPNQQILHFAMEELPPYSYAAGNAVVGTMPDVLNELTHRLNLVADFKLLPWKRAYASARDEASTCVLAGQDDERKPLFNWIGPIIHDQWVIVSRSDSFLSIKSIEDARPHRIGAYQGDARAVALSRLGFNIELTADDQLNPRKLDAGRIDLWITSEAKANALIDAPNAPALKILLTWVSEAIYLACNRGTEPGLIKSLGEAWKEMKADGTAEKLLNKNKH